MRTPRSLLMLLTFIRTCGLAGGVAACSSDITGSAHITAAVACHEQSTQWCASWRETYYPKQPGFGPSCEPISESECVQALPATMSLEDHVACLDAIDSQTGDWAHAEDVPRVCGW